MAGEGNEDGNHDARMQRARLGRHANFAAAVAPVAIDVIADLNGFGGTDEDFRERFYVPGIQRAGGLSAALKLVNGAHDIIQTRVSTPPPTAVEDQ